MKLSDMKFYPALQAAAKYQLTFFNKMMQQKLLNKKENNDK